MSRWIVLCIAFLFVMPTATQAQLVLVGSHQLSSYQQEDLEQMMRDMLTWIAQHSRYVVPSELPEMEFVSSGEAYGEPIAFFDGAKKRLQISHQLDVFQSAFDQALLLHELVHYAQWSAGESFRDTPEACQQDLTLEVEAYVLQRHYYFTHGGRYMPAMIPVLFCDANGQLKAVLQE